MKNIIETLKYVDFVKKKYSVKVRDRCHLTRNYRAPAHIKGNNIVKQKQSILNPFVYQIFFNCDCHLFLKN